ncbi:MAG TPA: HPF/RaiA family ribosome-associated protein [Candidatus Andersenbacteria bacterium]|nr:HPF/RaiA family ribosome-associated protein [Candidatus Andersenbacteria bacterium]
MQYSLRTDHIELSQQDTEKLEQELQKLEKHVVPPFVTHITFIHDTHHVHGSVIRCIIIIEQGKHVYRAERSEDSVANAIDSAVTALKSELSSDHDRRKEHS